MSAVTPKNQTNQTPPISAAAAKAKSYKMPPKPYQSPEERADEFLRGHLVPFRVQAEDEERRAAEAKRWQQTDQEKKHTEQARYFRAIVAKIEAGMAVTAKGGK